MSVLYPVDGALLTCSKGSQNAYLSVSDKGTTIGTKFVGIETESSPNNVTGHFGTCSFVTAGHGNICIKAFSGNWQNTSAFARFGVYTQALTKVCGNLYISLWYYEQYKKQVFAAMDTPQYFISAAFRNAGTGMSELDKLVMLNPDAESRDDYSLAAQNNIQKMDTVKAALRSLPAADTAAIYATIASFEHIHENSLDRDAIEEKASTVFENLRYNLSQLQILYNTRLDQRLVIKYEQYYTVSVRYLDEAKVKYEALQNETDLSTQGVLTMDSMLGCPSRNGMITFVTDNQKIPSGNELKDAALANLRERVRKAIRAHYGFPADENQTSDDSFHSQLTALGMSDLAIENYQTIHKTVVGEDKKTELLNELNDTQQALEAALESGSTDVFEKQELAEAARQAYALVATAEEKQTALNEITEFEKIVKWETGTYSADEQARLLAEFGSPTDTARAKIARLIDSRAWAEDAIERFKVNEDNANKEEDPMRLLAWLVLLGESDLDTIRDEVENRVYFTAGLVSWYADRFTEENFGPYLDAVKETAYALPVKPPLYLGIMTANYYIYDPYYYQTYKGDHSGVDFGNAHVPHDVYVEDILATYSGEVKEANGNGKDFGHIVRIRQPAGATNSKERDFYYAHLVANSYNGKISVGGFVLAGKHIATKGMTGTSVAHLHYEVRPIGGGYGSNMKVGQSKGGTGEDNIYPNEYIPSAMNTENRYCDKLYDRPNMTDWPEWENWQD